MDSYCLFNDKLIKNFIGASEDVNKTSVHKRQVVICENFKTNLKEVATNSNFEFA